MKKKTRLPEDEIRFLSGLSEQLLKERIRALWESGWSLAVIANSLKPVRPKSTVHFWVQNTASTPQRRPIPPTPPKSLTTTAPLSDTPITRSISPGVPAELKPRLKQLADLSRRYRAKTPPNSPLAEANRELTVLATELYDRGIPAAAIAEAAGVTYRAMARRLSNAYNV
jgi:hypothetical protein